MENNIAVNVAVRVRPLLSREKNNVVKYIHEEGEPPVLMVCDKRNIYAFDNVFSSEVHQCEVYNVMVKPLVHKVLDGYNSTILAYGQTGTGKTYTMGTDSNKYHDTDSGLIPRVLDEFFDVCIRDPDLSVSVSFIEIYNEKVYDLLRPTKTALVVKGFCVTGMTCVQVEHNEDARHWLLVGGKGRHVRHTALNASSSRSHAIFTVYCTRTDTGVTSKLHLVDLAGSESVRRTGNQGQAFHEGVTINRGLLAVGRVINALSDKKISVIPYRDSTLTTILHDSLSTNNYVSLLACISPSDTDISETLATLRFAVKAKSVKSKPQLENIVTEYDRLNPGILGNIEPNPMTTTIKKKRKMPSMFTSTQVKKPFFGNKNASIQSVDTRSDRFTSSPNFASTLDSLSISTSTTIDACKQPFNLSPIVRRCTEALQNTVLEHVNAIIQEKMCATPALFANMKNKDDDKENTSPPVIVHWPTVENKMTEIIRKEIAEMTGNGNNLNATKSVSSPLVKRLVRFLLEMGIGKDFDSPTQSPTLESSKPGEPFFKVPIPIHRNVKRLKESVRKSVSIGTSPIIPVRRSTRLSIKISDISIPPTPAPRFKISDNSTRVDETPSSNFSSPFKLTRRSVRLSMKCIPKETELKSIHKPVENEDSSFENDFMPVPIPRKSVKKSKTPKKKSNSPLKIFNSKWSTPKKISGSPKKKHKFRVLRILNVGSQKEIQCLATVGVKTAMQIITYRTLNGEFKKLEEIKNIPTWGQKKFDKFMLANQLV